jgi:hypothetical protein
VTSNRRSNVTPEPRSVEASLEVLRALTDKYGWEPHSKAHAAALALLRSELARLRGIEEALRRELGYTHGEETKRRLTEALARPYRQEEGE